jgi:superoxide dismutase
VQYEGNKEAYVEQFWRHIDWEKVCSNFEKFNFEGGKVAPLID